MEKVLRSRFANDVCANWIGNRILGEPTLDVRSSKIIIYLIHHVLKQFIGWLRPNDNIIQYFYGFHFRTFEDAN